MHKARAQFTPSVSFGKTDLNGVAGLDSLMESVDED
jgi:hypothetical protein